MKLKINKGLLPIKAHYFFFFAALGPILPQLNVFGKQLGVSPQAMGLVTAVLPLFWALAKPSFGYVVDYFTSLRKFLFMTLIIIMSGSYCGLWFLPPTANPTHLNTTDTNLTFQSDGSNSNVTFTNSVAHHGKVWMPEYVLLRNSSVLGALNDTSDVISFSCFGASGMMVRLKMLVGSKQDGAWYFDNKVNCSDIGLVPINGTLPNKTTTRNVTIATPNDVWCLNPNETSSHLDECSTSSPLHHQLFGDASEEGEWLYGTVTFWLFVVLMCVGTVAFNVANCISDAICFDVLGAERATQYGAQRAWGTAGYGATALLAGYLVDRTSRYQLVKDFTPAFVLVAAFTLMDLYSCRALTLPKLTSADEAPGALRAVLRSQRVLIFILFAVVVGVFDSFIIYYLFWHVEELAEQTGSLHNIKLLEGLIVAAQSFVGEMLFFFLSGKILKRWGYGTTLTLCLLAYSLRLALVSVVTAPWQLVITEGILQGPTYALCYSAIVGYAALVAPEGYSATMQGIVAGMDDGVGFAIGSLLGGQLYGALGGPSSFQVMAVAALVAAVLHAVLHATVLKTSDMADEDVETKSLPESATLEERQRMMRGHDGDRIYRDTVLPLNTGRKGSWVSNGKADLGS